MHCAATSSFWNAPKNMVISNWIWTLSGFGACAVWGDLKLLGHFQVLERFIFINVSAINNSKHSHNSPSLFFPDLNFNFFKIFFLSGEFPSQVSQSHLQTENKTLIWLFSDVMSIGLEQKVILQDVMLYAFCSFKNHKPVCLKVCLFPKKPSATPTECTCEDGFRLIHRHAFSRKQQSPLTSQIYCECKQRVEKKPGWNPASCV